MSKYYFVKVSYTDVNQPLRRVHENHTGIYIDFSKDIWTQVEEQAANSWGSTPDFTVDFIFEIPEV